MEARQCRRKLWDLWGGPHSFLILFLSANKKDFNFDFVFSACLHACVRVNCVFACGVSGVYLDGIWSLGCNRNVVACF